MSAPACLMFYGVRYDVGEGEIEALEERSDPRIVSARKNGLKFYWGNFGLQQERWLLFVGANLGTFGLENSIETALKRQELDGLIKETEFKLRQAGFSEEPKLYVQWQPDA
jgi:hypothetical protein